MFRTLTHCAIVTLALILVMANTAAEATLINTYTPTAGNPATGPYDSNITTNRSGIFNTDHESRKLVDGVSAKNPGDQSFRRGFFGTQPNFTDTDGDGFPDYGTDPESIWYGPPQITPPASDVDLQWVSFTLPSSATLDFMRVWNANQGGVGSTTRGVQDAYVWYAPAGPLPAIAASTGGGSPGAGWTQLTGPGTGGIFTFAIAPGVATYDGESISLQNITAEHILIDIETNHGGGYVGPGLSEVQFFAAVIPEPATLALLGLGGLAMLRRRRA
jgi:hypothetical protein